MSTIKDFYRGDTKVYSLAFTRSGVAIDITGYTIRFTMKSNQLEVDPGDLQVDAEFVNAEAGTASITLTSAMTKALAVGQYYYDIRALDAYGQVATVVNNRVKVLQNTGEDFD